MRAFLAFLLIALLALPAAASPACAMPRADSQAAMDHGTMAHSSAPVPKHKSPKPMADHGCIGCATPLQAPFAGAVQTLANGRTTVLQGVIHLMLFAIYLFTTFVP